MKWFKIIDEIDENLAIQKVEVNNKVICLIHHKNKFIATSNKCPHAGAQMCGGWLEENAIVCPFHRHKFNLENGRGAPGQGDYLEIYPLEQRKDGLYIQISENWLKRILNLIFFKSSYFL